MILPSEPVSDNSLPGMPMRLRNGYPRREKVSRLEFYSVDRSEAELSQGADAGLNPTETEARLRQEVVALEKQLKSQAQEIATRVEAAEWKGRDASRAEWEEELEEQVARERSRVMRVCEAFGKERAQYFSGVEAEVVKLTLAIAARVLHREVKLDPLLLTAAVRIALQKVADSSTTILRVPIADVERWREAFVAGTETAVQLLGDEDLDVDECVLETAVGRVELGISAQLEEIEKGFFDLLQQRPT